MKLKLTEAEKADRARSKQLLEELRTINGYARYGHAFKRRHEDRPPRKGRGVSSR